jgi:outer membrane protein assembly factor BamB
MVLFSGYTKFSDNKDQYTVEIIANGAQVRNANGILFDSNDKLYVTSAFGREIIVLDPETGEIIKRLGIESGVKCPDDLMHM